MRCLDCYDTAAKREIKVVESIEILTVGYVKCNSATSAAMKMQIKFDVPSCVVFGFRWNRNEQVLDVYSPVSQTASFVPSSATFLHFAFTGDGNSLWKGVGSFI